MDLQMILLLVAILAALILFWTSIRPASNRNSVFIDFAETTAPRIWAAFDIPPKLRPENAVEGLHEFAPYGNVQLISLNELDGGRAVYIGNIRNHLADMDARAPDRSPFMLWMDHPIEYIVSKRVAIPRDWLGRVILFAGRPCRQNANPKGDIGIRGIHVYDDGKINLVFRTLDDIGGIGDYVAVVPVVLLRSTKQMQKVS